MVEGRSVRCGSVPGGEFYLVYPVFPAHIPLPGTQTPVSLTVFHFFSSAKLFATHEPKVRPSNVNTFLFS